MTLLEEAKEHMEKMSEHVDCCGMPIFRRMVAELEAFHAGAALGIPGPLTIKPAAPDAAK